jgi:hypothetical protein
MGRYVLVVALLVGLSDSAFARDDGRYADNPLKYWFDNLSSGNGMGHTHALHCTGRVQISTYCTPVSKST